MNEFCNGKCHANVLTKKKYIIMFRAFRTCYVFIGTGDAVNYFNRVRHVVRNRNKRAS